MSTLPRPLPVAHPNEWALPAPTTRLTECPDCHQPRYGSGPHSPHWRDGRVVDCQLRPVVTP